MATPKNSVENSETTKATLFGDAAELAMAKHSRQVSITVSARPWLYCRSQRQLLCRLRSRFWRRI